MTHITYIITLVQQKQQNSTIESTLVPADMRTAAVLVAVLAIAAVNWHEEWQTESLAIAVALFETVFEMWSSPEPATSTHRAPRAPPPSKKNAAVRLFTAAELRTHDGTPQHAGGPGGGRIYLAILGDVFDVSTGARHYAAGKSYAHFAGRDASRSFATGETGGGGGGADRADGGGLTDDLAGLGDDELRGIAGWHKFFVDHQTCAARRAATPANAPLGRALRACHASRARRLPQPTGGSACRSARPPNPRPLSSGSVLARRSFSDENSLPPFCKVHARRPSGRPVLRRDRR